jgi:oligogalacturonide lyase
MPTPALHRSAPEWRRYTDERTGASIRQWTAHESMHHHFYFTNPTLSADAQQGYFISYRTGYPNLFRIDLRNGELTRLTNRPDINPFSPVRNPRTTTIYFTARHSLWSVSPETGEERELCRFPRCRLGTCGVDPSGAWLALGLRFEDRCELALVDTATGHWKSVAREPEIGHVQFCPDDPNMVLYSGAPNRRLWIYDRQKSQTRYVYPQKEGEWIVHESWLSGLEILFVHWPHALRAIRADGTGLRTIAKINAWHACADCLAHWIICDTNHPDRGLLLVNPDTGNWKTLCWPGASLRGTQWIHNRPAQGAGIDTSIIRSDTPEDDPPPKPNDPPSTYGPQWTHPHPSFSVDGRQVVYTSDRERWSQVFSVEVPSGIDD